MIRREPLSVKKGQRKSAFNQCRFEGGAVQFAGNVNRAFSRNGIPTGRIRDTVPLAFQAHVKGSIGYAASDHLPGGFPGCAARGTAKHLYFRDYPILEGNGELGGTEFFPVITKHTVPGKCASGGRRDGSGPFFPRGDDRNIQFPAFQCEIVGQIRVFQEIEYQIRIDRFR